MANNETIEATEAAAEKTAKVGKILAWCGGGVALVTIGVLVYIFGVRNPGIENGNKAIGEVDVQAVLMSDQDSTVIQMYQDIADKYDYYAGDRAAFMAACGLYRQGKYEEALKYINKYDGDDEITAALAKGLKGDCLVNLDKYDEALKAFDSAISTANGNPDLVPYFMTKKAVVLAEQGKHGEAVKLYEQIEKEYPFYASQMATRAAELQQQGLAETAE